LLDTACTFSHFSRDAVYPSADPAINKVSTVHSD
jgi:hypothetical protein